MNAPSTKTWSGRHARHSFLEQTAENITRTISQSLFAEDIARQKGFLQSIDSRAKLLGMIALVLAVSISRSLAVIAVLYLLTLPAAAASLIPMRTYIKRAWLFMPFFTGVIALPAVFSPFTPGPPLLILLDLASPSIYLAITLPGVITAAFLLMRVAASVSVVMLLVLTTRWTMILKALRVLHVPQAIVMILGLTYRYIFVLLNTASNMLLARKSRLVGRIPAAENRKWIAASMGVLLAKSYALSDEVFLAMQSRGYRGEARVIDALVWRKTDWLALAGFIVLSAGAIWLGNS